MKVRRLRETARFPAGALWVAADQPHFEIAVQMLEPEAPDSLLKWGFLSTVVERKEYIAPAVLEPLVQKMLEDPKTRAEWEAALADGGLRQEPARPLDLVVPAHRTIGTTSWAGCRRFG